MLVLLTYMVCVTITKNNIKSCLAVIKTWFSSGPYLFTLFRSIKVTSRSLLRAQITLQLWNMPPSPSFTPQLSPNMIHPASSALVNSKCLQNCVWSIFNFKLRLGHPVQCVSCAMCAWLLGSTMQNIFSVVSEAIE